MVISPCEAARRSISPIYTASLFAIGEAREREIREEEECSALRAMMAECEGEDVRMLRASGGSKFVAGLLLLRRE